MRIMQKIISRTLPVSELPQDGFMVLFRAAGIAAFVGLDELVYNLVALILVKYKLIGEYAPNIIAIIYGKQLYDETNVVALHYSQWHVALPMKVLSELAIETIKTMDVYITSEEPPAPYTVSYCELVQQMLTCYK